MADRTLLLHRVARRKLCVLLCTHPDPSTGPLYLPAQIRDEYATDLGFKETPPCWCGLWRVVCGLGPARRNVVGLVGPFVTGPSVEARSLHDPCHLVITP